MASNAFFNKFSITQSNNAGDIFTVRLLTPCVCIANCTLPLARFRAFEDLGVSAYNGAGKLLADANNLLIAGKIVSVAAEAGAKLKKGDPILVLEAMKMEHTLTAPFDGKLAELNAKPGVQVSEGVLLAKLEKE